MKETTASAFCSTQKVFYVCVADLVQVPADAGGNMV